MVNATTAVTNVVETTNSYATKIAVAIAFIIGGLILGMLAKKLLHKVLKELGLNKIMRKVNVTYDIEAVISSTISYVIYFLAVIFALKQFGVLPEYIVYLLVGAILTMLALTFIVGLKDIIPNFVAWILLQRRGKIKEGKRVEIREISGVVEKIGFLESEIKTDSDDILYVPNSLFLKSKVKIRH